MFLFYFDNQVLSDLGARLEQWEASFSVSGNLPIDFPQLCILFKHSYFKYETLDIIFIRLWFGKGWWNCNDYQSLDPWPLFTLAALTPACSCCCRDDTRCWPRRTWRWSCWPPAGRQDTSPHSLDHPWNEGISHNALGPADSGGENKHLDAYAQ